MGNVTPRANKRVELDHSSNKAVRHTDEFLCLRTTTLAGPTSELRCVNPSSEFWRGQLSFMLQQPPIDPNIALSLLQPSTRSIFDVSLRVLRHGITESANFHHPAVT